MFHINPKKHSEIFALGVVPNERLFQIHHIEKYNLFK